MKRVGNIYDKELSLTNLYQTYKQIYRNCKNKNEIYEFNLNKNINLFDIYLKLRSRKFKFKRYKIFLIKEPKYRLIMSEYVEDKIVNHFVAHFYLVKYLEKSLIYSNVATRKEMGSKLAFSLFEKYITKNSYILKLDISKYFYNINHEILINLASKKIKDREVLSLIEDILNTTNEEYVNEEINYVKNKEIYRIKRLNITDIEKNKKQEEINKIPLYKKGYGLPIGNMTSQILAILYLNEIDHYIKEELKINKYIRYMDDLVIIDHDYSKLKMIKKLLIERLKTYKLEVNHKCQIYNITKGVEFLGYRYKYLNNKLIIRYNKQTINRINKKLKKYYKYDVNKFITSSASYKGYLRKSNTKLKEKYLIMNKLEIKYNHYKRKYPDYLIIVKEGKFYKSLDYELIWYLFGYKVIDKLCSFSDIEKVKIRLTNNQINYLIISDEEETASFDNNNYERMQVLSIHKYDLDDKIKTLTNKITLILNKDISKYSKLLSILQI